jgi:hypothetical protein
VAGICCINERICAMRLSPIYPKAIAIITAKAKPTRAVVFARPE